MFSVDDHLAAIAVQQGMNALSSMHCGTEWVPQVYLDRIHRLKVKGLPIKYDLGKPGEGSAFTKAAPRLATKTEDTPENRTLVDQSYAGDSSGWSWSSWEGWQF